MSTITVGRENSETIGLYYEDHGAGRAVVLIHGFPLSGRSWERQVTALLGAGYRVITYDRRGFGQSSQPASGYDFDTLAEDLHRLMTVLDLFDAVLVGFSMGSGDLARYLARHGADRVSGAVFISSLAPCLLKLPDHPDGIKPSVLDGIIESIKADRLAFLSGFLHDFYNLDKLAGVQVSDEVVRDGWNIASRASAIGTLRSVGAWRRDFRDDVRRIDVPVLIVHGDEDRIAPMSATGGPHLHQLIESSRLLVIAGAPHGLLWTHAHELNPELLAFIGQACPKRAEPDATMPRLAGLHETPLVAAETQLPPGGAL